MWILLALLVAAGPAAAGGTGPPAAEAARARVAPVHPSVETWPVRSHGDAADDPALWVHPADPARSRLMATDKRAGLAVYDLAGRELQFLAHGDLNNVDVRYGFPLAGAETDLVAASNRSDQSIRVYGIDAASGLLRALTAPGALRTDFAEIYGLCLYRSPATGRFHAFATSLQGELEQWELRAAAAGRVSGARVRRLAVGSISEGCVADDDTGALYVAEERVGIWRYGAEPGDGGARALVDAVGPGGHLTGEVEGLAIYAANHGRGYLLASSQGSDDYVVYRRDGDNAYVGRFPVVSGNGIDGTQDTDGIDVTGAPLGPAFPFGAFVAQDGRNGLGWQNFKLVRWDAIAGAFAHPLLIDTSRNPRRGR